MTGGDVVVGDAELRDYATVVLDKVGYPHAYAEEIADGLVEADLRGQSSHGVLHLANLVERTKRGLIDPSATFKTLANSPATARLDARNGPGIVLAARAMDLAVTKALAVGAGVVVVLNSTHFGMGALHSERAAASGCVGIAASNATPLMAAPGGAQPLIGTNPISIAVPGNGEIAMSLDMGLGQVTMGYLREQLRRGGTLPEGAALARDGTPTTDPATVIDGGSLTPAGGHKGFGLAVAVEILTGVLAGGSIVNEVGSLFVDFERPQGTCHLMLAISPRHFVSPKVWSDNLHKLVGWIRASRRAEGALEIYVPGERTMREIDRRLAEGVTIDPTTAAELVKLGTEYGVAAPSALR